MKPKTSYKHLHSSQDFYIRVNNIGTSNTDGTSSWSGNYGWYPASSHYRLVIGCPAVAYSNGDITVTDNSYGAAATISMTVGDSMSGWMTFTTATPSQAWCYVTESRIVNSAGSSTTWSSNNNIAIRDGTSTNNLGASAGYSGNGRYNTGSSCATVCTSWDLPTNHFEIVGSGDSYSSSSGPNTFKIRTTLWPGYIFHWSAVVTLNMVCGTSYTIAETTKTSSTFNQRALKTDTTQTSADHVQYI